jgi:hypothetical protein
VTGDQYEVERLVLTLMGHVRRGERLREQGAGTDELEANHIETERVRWRLANAVRGAAAIQEGPRAA